MKSFFKAEIVTNLRVVKIGSFLGIFTLNVGIFTLNVGSQQR